MGLSENEFLTVKEIMNDCKKGYFGRVEKKIKRRRQKIISKFQHDWKGLQYLCRDDDEAWEYWLKIYKKWEKRLPDATGREEEIE